MAKGEPENPATWEEIYNKFHTNAMLLISEKDDKKLGDIIAKRLKNRTDKLIETWVEAFDGDAAHDRGEPYSTQFRHPAAAPARAWTC